MEEMDVVNGDDLSQVNGTSFEEEYELCEIMAKRSCSIIRRCINRRSGQAFAVKIVDIEMFTSYPRFSMADIRREASVCQRLKHPNITSLLETFSTDKYFYFIYELLEGADLCFEIVRRALGGFVYSEAVASHYVRQILDAVRHCHSKQILHRSLAPHCVQLANKENSSPIKLTCFQSAIDVEELENNDYFVESDERKLASRLFISYEREKFGYVSSGCSFDAPERMRNEPYSKAVDVWSLGHILCVLLVGRTPYINDDIQLITRGRQWIDISEDAKSLVHEMLHSNPQQRITVEEALKHPWIRERGRAPKIHLNETVQSLIRFNTLRKTKESVMISVHSSMWRMLDHRSVQDDMSTQHNTALLPDPSISDLSEALRSPGVLSVLSSMDEVDMMVNSLDVDAVCALFNNKTLSSLLQVLHLALSILEADQNINSETLSSLLQLYDDISLKQLTSLHRLPVDCLQRTLKVKSALDENTSGAAIELQDIISTDYFQALLLAMDVLVGMVYSREACYLRESSPPVTSSSVTDPCVSVGAASSTGGFVNGVGGEGMMSPASPSESQELMGGEGEESVGGTYKVRLVQFQRNTDEPMGITLKLNPEGRCVIARIIHGGMIHRQGTLRVGDIIYEINGISTAGQTAEVLQRLLRDARGAVKMKVVPSYRTPPPLCEIFVRTLFDYDPTNDELIPCKQAGIGFTTGQILQARRWVSEYGAGEGMGSTAGLVPSPELMEWRSMCTALDKSNRHTGKSKRRSVTKDKYLAKRNAMFDQLDLVTYEEVVRLPAFRRKTLVLLGAHGVGRRHIKNTLISKFPERFAYPIPHTTRAPRKDEEQGKHYHFVTHQQMMKDISDNEYLEYGSHENAMYGTRLETIRAIHQHNLLAILDIEPQALKVLRTADFAPYVVFIAAPKDVSFSKDASLERLARESELLEKAYKHFFDHIIHNNDIDDTISQLLVKLEEVASLPQWVPVSWVY